VKEKFCASRFNDTKIISIAAKAPGQAQRGLENYRKGKFSQGKLEEQDSAVPL
jgi:hypothetical protein